VQFHLFQREQANKAAIEHSRAADLVYCDAGWQAVVGPLGRHTLFVHMSNR
jgi:hypothetical protein